MAYQIFNINLKLLVLFLNILNWEAFFDKWTQATAIQKSICNRARAARTSLIKTQPTGLNRSPIRNWWSRSKIHQMLKLSKKLVIKKKLVGLVPSRCQIYSRSTRHRKDRVCSPRNLVIVCVVMQVWLISNHSRIDCLFKLTRWTSKIFRIRWPT